MLGSPMLVGHKNENKNNMSEVKKFICKTNLQITTRYYIINVENNIFFSSRNNRISETKGCSKCCIGKVDLSERPHNDSEVDHSDQKALLACLVPRVLECKEIIC